MTMKLEKAIEIATDLTRYDYNPTNPDAVDALKLLIEAGKKIDFIRTDNDYYSNLSLPGETE